MYITMYSCSICYNYIYNYSKRNIPSLCIEFTLAYFMS